MRRLFTAIEIPAGIGAELSRLQHPLPGARWMEIENYHLTLRFAGDVEGLIAREFIANLSEIEFDTFELTVLGLGAFGGNDPHTLFAGFSPSPQLDSLARAHEKAARNAGLPRDKHAFMPHITLARLKYARPDTVASYLSQYSGYRSEPFFVSETVLMSSRPITGGGPYGIEERFPLRGGAFASEDEDAS